MAESVDALVSNTSGFTSIPVRPRVWVHEEKFERASLFFVLIFNMVNICAYKMTYDKIDIDSWLW